MRLFVNCSFENCTRLLYASGDTKIRITNVITGEEDGKKRQLKY